MNIYRDFDLSKILFYKIGGRTSFVLETKSIADIIEAFTFIKTNNIQKWFAVGLGTNLLVNDAAFNGAVIWIRHGDKPQFAVTQDWLLQAYAGDTLDNLIQYSFEQGFIGLEDLGGLPTTIGGAIHGNAGAFGTEIKNVIGKVEVFDVIENKTKTLSLQGCQFTYRDSIFKKNQNLIILQGVFKLQKTDSETVAKAKESYQEKVSYREANHPVEYPSCGSVFKNIIEQKQVAKIISVWPDIEDEVVKKWHGKVAMGYIIKRLGLAGMQQGGAEVSKKHSNYISNVNNAKFSDVIFLIDKVKDGFYNAFGFYPEVEVEIIQ